MQHHIHRRASLGLAIHGPFSRNHRRRSSLRESAPGIIAAALLTGLAAFIAALFQ